MTISKEDLRDLIDVCFDAVTESKAGPITVKDGFAFLGKDTFLAVLSQLVPKMIVNATPEPKEPWQGED